MPEATPDSYSFFNPLCLNFLIISGSVTHYVPGCEIFGNFLGKIVINAEIEGPGNAN